MQDVWRKVEERETIMRARIAELEAALRPFAEAWKLAVQVAPKASLGQLGAVAAYEVSGAHFKRAAETAAKQ